MRLIDADAFKAYMRNALEQTRNAYTDGGEWAQTITEQFCKDIDEQPTIEPQRKKGKWIEYDNSHCECPFCHEEWSYFDNEVEYFNYCPNCGAEMTEESEEPKRCDTCKHEKSRWFSRCADCSDYESWEGKDETGRSTTEN